MPRQAQPVARLQTRCRLRELRGERKLLELQELTGVSAGTLSQLEHGRMPRIDQIEALEQGYGPRGDWYAVDVLEDAA